MCCKCGLKVKISWPETRECRVDRLLIMSVTLSDMSDTVSDMSV